MSQITFEITRPRTVTVPAAPLRGIVEVMLRAHNAPQNASAHIQLRLLEKEGLNRCPCCSDPLSVLGYRHTKTSFEERETIRCAGCQTVFSLHEQQVA